MDPYSLVFLNGLTWAMTVFITAAGLTLVFGILHILNFAHGGFVMIGAYLASSALGRLGTTSIWVFLAVALGCAVVMGGVGAGLDRAVFRRLGKVNESYSLIATYALLMLCQGVVKLIWGIDVTSVSPPAELRGATLLGTAIVPKFVSFAVLCGIGVFVLLDHVVHRTELGKTVQSVAVDPWMSSVLGINVNLVFTGTVIAGVFLAGLAGALLSINQSLTPDMGSALIIQAFGVIVVGGMGNIRGAFIASLLLGLVTALGDRFVADIPGLFFYVALIAILLWRPQGLLKGLR